MNLSRICTYQKAKLDLKITVPDTRGLWFDFVKGHSSPEETVNRLINLVLDEHPDLPRRLVRDFCFRAWIFQQVNAISKEALLSEGLMPH